MLIFRGVDQWIAQMRGQDEFEEFEEPDWAKALDETGVKGGCDMVTSPGWPIQTHTFLGFLGVKGCDSKQETPAPGTSEAKQWEEDWDDAGWDDEDQDCQDTSLAWHVELERIRLRQDDSFQKRLKEELDKMDVKKWSGICVLTCSFSSTFYIRSVFLYIQQFENHLSDSCLRKWYKGFRIQQGAVNQIMCCSLRKAAAGMRALQVGQHPFWCSIDDVSGR